MKEKFLNGLNKASIGVMTVGIASPLFASETSSLSTLETTLTGVAQESVSAVGTIAGIAITIFAAKFVWTWGIGFFSKLARK